MARRLSLSKSERASPQGAELLSLCLRITDQGKLNEEGIRDLIRWLRNNSNAPLASREFLTQTVARVVADRSVSRDELTELHKAIERILPPESRKVSTKRRRERELIDSGVVLLTATDGKSYQLQTLVGRVEYGEQTIEGIRASLGNDVATVIEQHIKARERRFTGHIIRETEGGAWLVRLAQGGDCYVPIQGTRILSGTPPGPLVIAVSQSLAADIDRQTATPRNMLEFTTQEVAQRFNVSIDTVRKWIRDGHLAAGSVGNGSAAFEYRIPEDELLRFANLFMGR